MKVIRFPAWSATWSNCHIDVNGTTVRIITVTREAGGSAQLTIPSARRYLDALESGIRLREASGELNLHTAEGSVQAKVPLEEHVEPLLAELADYLTWAAGASVPATELNGCVSRIGTRLALVGGRPLLPLDTVEPLAADDARSKAWARAKADEFWASYDADLPMVRRLLPPPTSRSEHLRAASVGPPTGSGSPVRPTGRWRSGGIAGSVAGWDLGRMRAPRRRR